jgi:hypothetical protein
MQQALDVLVSYHAAQLVKGAEVIEALRARLAEPVPVAQAVQCVPENERLNKWIAEESEKYRMQMVAISTASFGYWKVGDNIHSDFVTIALKDVCDLYAKYEAKYKQVENLSGEALLGTIARAWCHKSNAHKEMDHDLALAIAEEIKLLAASPTLPALPEADQLTELSHAQYLALENCRMLASRFRKDEWAQHILRFCDQAGINAVHLRHEKATQPAMVVEPLVVAYQNPHNTNSFSKFFYDMPGAIPLGKIVPDTRKPMTREEITQYVGHSATTAAVRAVEQFHGITDTGSK